MAASPVSGRVEGQDAAVEILLDHRVDGLLQPVAALTLGQVGQPGAQLRLGHSRDVEVARFMLGEPVEDSLRWLRVHQF
jgi:hypothetical protein